MNSLRQTIAFAFAAVFLLFAGVAQAQQHQHDHGDASQKVTDGGISVDGWMGQIDAKEAAGGATLNDAKLAMHGDMMHVTTGPAVAYWNPKNTAKGSYTVSATFSEPEYMNLNNHPHPYGIFIGGNDMGTEKQSYLYCAAYGNGSFIIRGFGPEPFQMNGRRAETNDAVNKAADKGKPVTQDIAVSVTKDKVECSINGTVVGSYNKAEVMGEGKLKSTDGVFGVRFGHNTEGTVAGLKAVEKM